MKILNHPNHAKLETLLVEILEKPGKVYNRPVLDMFADEVRSAVECFLDFVLNDNFILIDKSPQTRSVDLQRIQIDFFDNGRVQAAFQAAYRGCAQELATDFLHKAKLGYYDNPERIKKAVDEIRRTFELGRINKDNPDTVNHVHSVFQEASQLAANSRLKSLERQVEANRVKRPNGPGVHADQLKEALREITEITTLFRDGGFDLNEQGELRNTARQTRLDRIAKYFGVGQPVRLAAE